MKKKKIITLADLNNTLKCIEKQLCKTKGNKKEMQQTMLDAILANSKSIKNTVDNLPQKIKVELRNQTTAVTSSLNELKTAIENNGTKLTTINSKITKTNSKLDEFKSKVDEVKTAIQGKNNNDVVAKLTEISTKTTGLKNAVNVLKNKLEEEFNETQAILNKEFNVEYQPFHEMLTAEKTYTDSLFSLTFKVKKGLADVNVNSTTIGYEEGDVITWDGKISSEVLKGSITITPQADSKVLVIGIKKV